MAVKIVFGKLKGGMDRQAYVKGKLTAFFKNEAAAAENEYIVTRQDLSVELPMTPVERYPSVSPQRWAEVQEGIKCFIKEMDRYYAAAPGEQITEDFVSYLQKDFGEFPQNTVVLRRTTNMATLYYVKANLQMSGDKWVTIPPKPPQVVGVGWDAAINALLFLAKNLASGGLSNIGSRMIDQLLGGNSIDLKQLEIDLAKIVKDANIEQTVAEQEGTIDGLIADVQGYYTTRRNSGTATKSELYAWLLDKEGKLSISLGILSQLEFQEKGFSSFVAGANLMYCLLQEMALQDPNVTDYHQSSNVTLLKNDIAKNIAYVTNLRTQIVNERNAQVGGVSSYNKCSSAGGYPVCDTVYYYKDKFDGSYHGDFYDDEKHDVSGRDTANKDRNSYIQNLTNQMAWVNDVLTAWNQLAVNPLPGT